ncbi:phage RecT family recombinase [Rhizobium tibeticum]|uniref:recombinase RecT n=1 Tax=Rhizobium tibeticum TaxID=501024 RepID=UPI00278514EA|nr:recombinase RecT [Rhizobium tibeticum]MDP9809402.1 phage RecT family recombinase [Rhizobium tibeticum]
MNVVTQAKPTKLDQFRMEVLPPERRQELVAGMPPHVRPERFERNLVNAMMQNPGLMDLDPRLIFREISKAAALGLYLDPQLGEAYLIESWNGKAKRKEPQLRIGYRGLIKLGRQSGEISMIYAHEVHRNDFFECSLGDHKSLVHKPDVFGDRGEIVGYYAVVKYQDGETDFEPVTVAQAHAIRDRSDGWKAFSEGKIKSTPWATDEVEMSKKTAIRRLTKRIPQSPELAEAINIEDAAEHSEMRNVTPQQPPKPPVPPPPPMEAIEDNSAAEDETVIEHDEPTAEEVVSDNAEVVDDTTYFEQLEDALAVVSDAASLEEVWTEFDPMARFDGKPQAETNQAIAKAIRKRAEKRIGGAA